MHSVIICITGALNRRAVEGFALNFNTPVHYSLGASIRAGNRDNTLDNKTLRLFELFLGFSIIVQYGQKWLVVTQASLERRALVRLDCFDWGA